MDERKLYKVNVYLPFSSLELPWTGYDQHGNVKPLRLDDPPMDGPMMIGFMPIFSSKEAAEDWCQGRWNIDEITLNSPAPPAPKPAHAVVRLPTAPVEAPAAPDLVINPRHGRRRNK